MCSLYAESLIYRQVGRAVFLELSHTGYVNNLERMSVTLAYRNFRGIYSSIRINELFQEIYSNLENDNYNFIKTYKTFGIKERYINNSEQILNGMKHASDSSESHNGNKNGRRALVNQSSCLLIIPLHSIITISFTLGIIYVKFLYYC